MTTRKRVIRKVVDNLPTGIKPFLNRIPDRFIRLSIECGLNRCFKTSIDHGALAFLQQKTASIQVPDTALAFSVTLDKTRLKVAIPENRGDVCFRGNFADFLLLISGKVDPDTLFFRRRLMVSGDTELGLALKNFLDTLDIHQLLPTPFHYLLEKTGDILIDPVEAVHQPL